MAELALVAARHRPGDLIAGPRLGDRPRCGRRRSPGRPPGRRRCSRPARRRPSLDLDRRPRAGRGGRSARRPSDRRRRSRSPRAPETSNPSGVGRQVRRERPGVARVRSSRRVRARRPRAPARSRAIATAATSGEPRRRARTASRRSTACCRRSSPASQTATAIACDGSSASPTTDDEQLEDREVDAEAEQADGEEPRRLEAGVALAGARRSSARFQAKLLVTATQKAPTAAAMWWTSSASVSSAKTIRLMP